MMGAIGEQAALCWGFEQDAQRFHATRNKITEEHHRLEKTISYSNFSDLRERMKGLTT